MGYTEAAEELQAISSMVTSIAENTPFSFENVLWYVEYVTRNLLMNKIQSGGLMPEFEAFMMAMKSQKNEEPRRF